MLHTRETWLKEGRVVRRGEAPYKVVKARKKKVSHLCVCVCLRACVCCAVMKGDYSSKVPTDNQGSVA